MTHVFRNQTHNMMAKASGFAQLQHSFDIRNSSQSPGKQVDDESSIVKCQQIPRSLN